MIKKLLRLLLPNPFDRMLVKLARKKGKRILLAWNRGLGDIALGLYAMVERIKEQVPDAEITFLIRENLQSGFSLLQGVKTIVVPSWKRGEPYDVKHTLESLGLDPSAFDLIVEKPNPTQWVRWQLGRVVPKLSWKREYDELYKKFDLPKGFTYIAVQISAETSYGQWRNWEVKRWRELEELLGPDEKLILFGFGKEPLFEGEKVIDLRGKTSLFEMISLIKNCCPYMIVPDSGILSMIYYLDVPFPIQVVSLWADPNHGILKQNVASPNPLLVHYPLVGKERDLSKVTAIEVYERLFPLKKPFKPLETVYFSKKSFAKKIPEKVGCVILAGGQGTRLGFSGPKGMFSIGGKTLFERIVQKIPNSVPIAIMTSPANHKETISYFEKQGQFGKKIFFFQQSTLPLLDEEKRPFGLEGADGNGSFYRRFVETKLADEFALLGVDTITITPVDNARADPLDPEWIDWHRRTFSDVTIRSIERSSVEESMGVLIERDGKVEILEYSEISLSEMQRVREDQKPFYLYAYTGLVACELSFIRRAANQPLPLHWVQKQVAHEGKTWSLWKGEKFLFDAFQWAHHTTVLCSPREVCYAPLKTKEGPNGIEAVEKALCQ